MKCIYCGAEIPDNSAYCNACGKAVPKEGEQIAKKGVYFTPGSEQQAPIITKTTIKAAHHGNVNLYKAKVKQGSHKENPEVESTINADDNSNFPIKNNSKLCKEYNIVSIFIIVILLISGVITINYTTKSTINYRRFELQEIESDSLRDNKTSYKIKNKTNESFKNCRLRVKLYDAYHQFLKYGYSDYFTLNPKQTVTIDMPTNKEFAKQAKIKERVVYVSSAKIILEGDDEDDL